MYSNCSTTATKHKELESADVSNLQKQKDGDSYYSLAVNAADNTGCIKLKHQLVTVRVLDGEI